jgi:regulator of cell morphogenesis and NO signaling
MMTITPTLTVGQIVAANPETGVVFERLGIDYCCGGKRTLEHACKQAGKPVEQVLSTLNQTAPQAGARDWSAASFADLTAHIERVHHGYLREELPRIRTLLAKVSRAHGERHPEYLELEELFAGFAAEMGSHMQKEEGVLFPAARALETGNRGTIPFESAIGVMEDEHDAAGRSLARMRELTGGYTPPVDACATLRVLMHALARLESDMHEHVHLENNILFPRVARTANAGITQTTNRTV